MTKLVFDPEHLLADQPYDTMWKQECVRLAHQRDLVGQAWKLRDADDAGAVTFACSSISEPYDHYITLLGRGRDFTIACDCPAGVHQKPCSHAGAVLMLWAGYATERTRDVRGNSR